MKDRLIQKLGEPDLTIDGLQLWIHNRQFPDAQDQWDGNWLLVTAHCGAEGASVSVSGPILMVTDLISLADDCQKLVGGEIKTAKLAPIEPELNIQISQTSDLGQFSMKVRITPDNLTQDHLFEFEIDQTHVRLLSKQCKVISARFPARGV